MGHTHIAAHPSPHTRIASHALLVHTPLAAKAHGTALPYRRLACGVCPCRSSPWRSATGPPMPFAADDYALTKPAPGETRLAVQRRLNATAARHG